MFQPDIVVGTSVGSLNGWLISAGAPPRKLVNNWLSLQWVRKPVFRRRPSFFDGILDTVLLEDFVREMTAISKPRCEFGVVLTHLRSLRPRLVRWPEADHSHLLASCAVPGFLPIKRFEKRWYADGGIVDPIALWAAVEMGAGILVSVNVMNRRSWALRTAQRTLAVCTRYQGYNGEAIRHIEINPSEPLGSPRDSLYWTLDNVRRWIDLGRRDAESALGAVVECSQSRS